MKKMKQFSIHMKVFFSFAAILLISILITLLFGSSVMEQLYINSKTNDLSDAYQSITDVMEQQNSVSVRLDTALLECLFEIEQNNIDVLMLTLQDAEAHIRYFTRKSWGSDTLEPDDTVRLDRRGIQFPALPSPMQFAPDHWIEDAFALGVFGDAELPLLVTGENADPINPHQTLDYYGCYNKGAVPVYIFLRTPKEAVSLAAALAVKYNLYIAMGTFLLMSITSYFVSRRITRHIAEISKAAERISRTDFSQPLDIHTGDELEDLSHSINSMAEKLQDYIYQLQLNQQLLEKDLEREAHTSQLRKEFIANVSHDFKTPLTLIRAYTETLRNQKLDNNEHQQYCDIILQENERLNHMVTQLLQLSRLESGAIQLELSYFPVEELIRDILYRNQLLVQQKNLQIHWEPVQENLQEDFIVEADYTRIEQVLTNLIDNAVKYTQDGGQIVLSVTANEALCQIAITNTSAPLSDTQLENLFISFYKTDESRHMEQQSFGLGLAIVKATLDLHRQPCKAQNTAQGLEISFSLPLASLDDNQYDDIELSE